MAYTITNQAIGTQPIAVTDTVQRHPLGMIIRANDPVYGGGERVHLPQGRRFYRRRLAGQL